MFLLWFFSLYSHWSPRLGQRSLCFTYMVFNTEIEQLKATVSLKDIAENIFCEDNTKMTSPFRLDTITLQFFRYTLYLLTEDCRKAWNFKYQNLVFSFLICVIIYIYILIYIYIQIGKRQLYFIWLNHVLLDLNNLSKDTAFMFTFTLFSSVKLTASKNF